MSDVLDKYRVMVKSYTNNGMWLKVEEYYPNAEGGARWSHPYGRLYGFEWRISGGYIMPSMWFKPIEERIRVAVGYAVAIVKDELAKENAGAKADALAAEWTEKAMAMFTETLKEGN